MTRINAGLDPASLKRMHLIAEYREITMVPAALKRSLKTKTAMEIKAGIPAFFTLNAGHVKFFYDKLLFLADRFDLLCLEMAGRGYTFNKDRRSAFDGFPLLFYNNWLPTKLDNSIVKERIDLRISQKPHLYLD